MTYMNNTQIFDEQFKYKQNQELRHKADNKGERFSSSDLGLLVVARYLKEELDADGKPTYERLYLCRMVKFSGSGDQAFFNERELLDMHEYNKFIIHQERERQQMRDDVGQTTKEVFEAFGVQRNTEVHLIINKVVDKSVTYKVTGFKGEGGKYELSLRAKINLDRTSEENVYVKSKDEFVLANTEQA